MRCGLAMRWLAAVLFASFSAGMAAADEPPAKTERLTCRVLGLFSKDREKDLREAFEELPQIKLVELNFEDAEITIEFVAKVAFPDSKANERVERLDQKLRNASHNTFSAKLRSTVDKVKLKEIVIPVRGLDCKACCLAAYESVAQLDGVEQATASFKEGRITARIDPGKTSRAKLEEALKKKGVELGK